MYVVVFSYYNIILTCKQVSLVIMYLILTNPCNHKICVATFTQTPFMYYDTSTFLNGGALPIISLLYTLQNTFNNSCLIVYLGIPWKCDNVSSLIDKLIRPGKRHMALLSLSIIFLRAPYGAPYVESLSYPCYGHYIE